MQLISYLVVKMVCLHMTFGLCLASTCSALHYFLLIALSLSVDHSVSGHYLFALVSLILVEILLHVRIPFFILAAISVIGHSVFYMQNVNWCYDRSLQSGYLTHWWK
jgi:hypothetical protein